MGKLVTKSFRRAQLGSIARLFKLLKCLAGVSAHLKASRSNYISKVIDRVCKERTLFYIHCDPFCSGIRTLLKYLICFSKVHENMKMSARSIKTPVTLAKLTFIVLGNVPAVPQTDSLHTNWLSPCWEVNQIYFGLCFQNFPSSTQHGCFL